MKIKRYFAPDIKQAMRMVREEQGPDAVILSNRKVDGGVEIVAARDFDEQTVAASSPPAAAKVQTAAVPAPRPAPAPKPSAEPKRAPVSHPATSANSVQRSEAQRRAEEVFLEALGESSRQAPVNPPRISEPPPWPVIEDNRAPVASRLREDVVRLNAAPQPALRQQNPLREPAAPMEARHVNARLDNSPLDQHDFEEDDHASLNQAYIQNLTATASPHFEPAARSQEPPRPNRGQGLSSGKAPAPKKMTREGNITGARSMQELQREINQMRQAIDTHEPEAAWRQAASPVRGGGIALSQRLEAYGFSKKLTAEVANWLAGIEDEELAWQGCQDILANRLPVVQDNLLDYGGIVALVGPTGVGKTTTIAKIAAKFRLKHGPRSIGLVSTDNFRIGAQEQLATYGRILGIPVRTATNADELRGVLAGFYDKRLVLIDTAGMGPRDMRLAEQFAMLRQGNVPIKSYLVLSAASQGRAMKEAIKAFSGFAFQSCILSKLDETRQLGTCLSTLIEQQLPVSMCTDGQQVPEDLHLARTQLLLQKCFAHPLDEDDSDEMGEPPVAENRWGARAYV